MLCDGSVLISISNINYILSGNPKLNPGIIYKHSVNY